jgi:hypothetical protein
VPYNIEVIAATLPRKSQCGVLVTTQRPDIRLLMLVKLAKYAFHCQKFGLSGLCIYIMKATIKAKHSIE